MRGGSKKGSKFERTMCKDFSLWFTCNKEDDCFWRTPSSGGRATERVKKGLTAADYAGDMMAIKKIGRRLTRHCLLEFKSGYSRPSSRQKLSLTATMDAPKNEKTPLLITWWAKLVKECSDHDKQIPLLVFKRDRKNACIVMDSKTWLMRCKFQRHGMPTKYAIIRYKENYLVVMPLNDFFTAVKPKWFYSEKPKIKLKRRRKK